jgi:hypothetical protein
VPTRAFETRLPALLTALGTGFSPACFVPAGQASVGRLIPISWMPGIVGNSRGAVEHEPTFTARLLREKPQGNRLKNPGQRAGHE